MANISRQDGIDRFNQHDAAGYFKKIAGMTVNTDFSITRIPKDLNDPGMLLLHDPAKYPPAFANAYVDAFNFKYNKQATSSSYAPAEASKNNYPATDPTQDGGVVGGSSVSLPPELRPEAAKTNIWIWIILAAIVIVGWLIIKRRRRR